MDNVIIHTDGGARGNPGPAGIGIVIEGLPSGKVSFGEYIGETTNNEAEYRALIAALRKLKDLLGDDRPGQISCYADSELMIKQLKGEYKVKDTKIRGFFLELQVLRSELQAPISFHHVRRSENAEADELVNKALDQAAEKP